MRKTDLVSYLQMHILKLEPEELSESLSIRKKPAKGKAAENETAVPFSVAHHPTLYFRTRRVPLTK